MVTNMGSGLYMYVVLPSVTAMSLLRRQSLTLVPIVHPKSTTPMAQCNLAEPNDYL